MQIIVDIEEATVVNYYKRGAPLFFSITWEHEGVYYPSKDWCDFGIVILDWWFSAINQLQEGASEGTFTFMDGPYSIGVAYNASTGIIELAPEGLNVKWPVMLTQCIAELIHASDEICQKLALLKIDEKEWLSLKLGAAKVKAKLHLS